MRHTSLHTQPVSMHLRRHRECLERRSMERRAAPATGDRDKSELSPLGRPSEHLPFQARDDED